MPGPFTSPVAQSVPFEALRNPDFNGGLSPIVSNDCQNAIEEVLHLALGSSVSAFIASYGGNANVGRYLEIFPSISSDVAGLLVPITEMSIKVITLGAISTATATVGIFKKSDLVTPIHSISLTAQDRISEIGLNVMLSQGDEVVVRVTAGSMNKPFMRIWIAGTV